MLTIHSIETFGTHEGPGIRLVVFLQGCHFRCLYCHNPDTWKLDGGKQIDIQTILDQLEKQKDYFGTKGGLTISGGEPLIQREALIPLFKEVKKRGFHTALDTNGAILDDKTKELFEYTDLILLDIKHIDAEKHKKLTGVHNMVPLKIAEYRESTGKPMWLRHVLVPGYTDKEEDLRNWANTFKEYKCVERVEILPYHTFGVYKYKELGIEYPLEKVQAATRSQAEQAQKIFSEYFKNVYIR